MKILVVDDIAQNRKLLRVQLEAEQIEVAEAADGVEALHVLACEKFDAVISDILMPRMDGYRLCHEIRRKEQLRELRFVLYSSTYTSPTDVKLSATVGADHFIAKPAPVQTILGAVRVASTLPAACPAILPEEGYVLKEYSATLVTKLEEKNAELQTALSALQRSRDRFAELNAALERRVAERTREIEERNEQLEREIAERHRAEGELATAQARLIDAARLAGRAETATNVLHSVGNVLNSINVSAQLLTDRVQGSKITQLTRVRDLLRAHESDLGGFVANDPTGRLLPPYLIELTTHLLGERQEALDELAALRTNVERINVIVSMQQSLAKVAGLQSMVVLSELVEDCVRLSLEPGRRQLELVREFEETPPLSLDRRKALEILANLVINASQSCVESGRSDARITLRIERRGPHVAIAVADNGVGIAPDNLGQIFGHGFTTKKDGHGFGLHSAALAAKELGGELTAASAGAGCGATFTLVLPVEAEAKQAAA